MIHGSCGTATLFNLLCILFLFFSGVDAQSLKHINKCAPIPAPWWKALNNPEFKFKPDPCQEFNYWAKQSGFSLNCCFGKSHGDQGSHQNRDEKGSDNSCGPCNLQSFNLASACLACVKFPNVQPTENDMQSNKDFPSITSWQENQSNNNTYTLNSSPSWVNVTTTPGGMFDIQQALQNALTPSLPASSTRLSPSTLSDSGTSTSPTSSETTGSASVSPLNAPTAVSNHGGVIAGGVIGGLLFLALVALGVFYFLRRRRRKRSAPSAEFMPVSGPSYVVEEPSQFGPGSWSPPPLEKVYTNTSPRGLMINPTPWERDIEKY